MKIILENWRLFAESHTKEHEEELKTIVGELEKASEMHAGQAKRIQQMLDETDDDKLEEGDKKNCGCGQDPCKTYGMQVKIKEEDKQELEEDCQDGYERVPGSKEFARGSCREKTDESLDLEAIIKEELETVLAEKKKKKRKKKKKKGNKICPKGIAWAKRTFDTYPSAYANLAASKYCKDPNYGKGKKKKKTNEAIDIIEGELQKWLDQDWKRISSSGEVKGECGTSKDKKNPDRCLPASKASSMSKPERAATATKKKKAQKTGKDSGKTSNVANTKKGKVTTKESLDLEIIIREELDAVLAEKTKKPCKPSKGKRFAKRVNGKCRSFGQKGQAKGGGDRIRPGTKKGDAYCARSAKIKKCKNPPCANALSRKKWKCRGSKSMKEQNETTN